MEYNRVHNITPTTIKKNIDDILSSVYEADYWTVPVVKEEEALYMSEAEFKRYIERLRQKMKQAAKRLEFEEAARIRDRIKALEEERLRLEGAM